MELRSAQAADSAQIPQIARSARETAMPYLPDLHTPAEDLAFYSSELENSNCQVALVAGQVVGFGCVRNGWLNHLYVSPEFQGQGIGSALLNQLNGEIQQFWVFQKNLHARDFYKRRGFVEVEFTNGEGNEEQEPDVRFSSLVIHS